MSSTILGKQQTQTDTKSQSIKPTFSQSLSPLQQNDSTIASMNVVNSQQINIDNMMIKSQSQQQQHYNKESYLNNNDQQSLTSTTKRKRTPFSSQNSINSLMWYGTRYEVKCNKTFAYYEGYVIDYDQKQQKLHVSYLWKKDEKVYPHYIRPIAPPIDPKWKPKKGDHVECQAKAAKNEPYGWWKCKIKAIRDNLYGITYDGWSDHFDVLPHNMLRPYNKESPFEDGTITCKLKEISQERIDELRFGESGDLSLTLKRIAKQTNLIHLNYHPLKEKLMLIGGKQEIDDAEMLIDFIFNLDELYKPIKLYETQIQKEYDKLKQCVSVKFRFNKCFAKYVIGLNGANIQKARKDENVKHINVRSVNDEIYECLILATDQYAADEARNILEIKQDFELIPHSVRRELIGKNGENIQRIEQRSNVFKIATLNHLKTVHQKSKNKSKYPSFIDETPYEDPKYDKLIIIGPKENILFAKLLINSQIDLIEQKREFTQRQQIAKRIDNRYR